MWHHGCKLRKTITGSRQTDSLECTFDLQGNVAGPLTALCTAGVVLAQAFQKQRAAILGSETSLVGQSHSIHLPGKPSSVPLCSLTLDVTVHGKRNLWWICCVPKEREQWVSYGTWSKEIFEVKVYSFKWSQLFNGFLSGLILFGALYLLSGCVGGIYIRQIRSDTHCKGIRASRATVCPRPPYHFIINSRDPIYHWNTPHPPLKDFWETNITGGCRRLYKGLVRVKPPLSKPPFVRIFWYFIMTHNRQQWLIRHEWNTVIYALQNCSGLLSNVNSNSDKNKPNDSYLFLALHVGHIFVVHGHLWL